MHRGEASSSPFKFIAFISIIMIFHINCECFPNEVIENRKIDHEKFCFTFNVPKSWKMYIIGKDACSLYFMDKNRNCPKKRLTVGTRIGVPKVKDKNILRGIAKYEISKDSSYIIKEGTVFVGNKEGYQITWTYKKNEKEFITTYTIFNTGYAKQGNGFVCFIVISNKEHFNKHNIIVDQIIESIKFR